MLLIYLLEVTFFILKWDILPTAPSGFAPPVMESKSIAFLLGYEAMNVIFYSL